jgi:tyrosine-protein kinase Etk/Wzc
MSPPDPVFAMPEPPTGRSLLRLLRDHPRLTLVPCGLALATGLVVTLATPKIYESVATVLAPRESRTDGLLSGLAAVSGLLVQAPAPALPSLTPNRDVLTSVLRSRTMAGELVERFGLQARYRSRHVDDAIATLRRTTTVSVSKEGVISVAVEDTDPRLAAQMANFYLDELDRVVARFGMGEASRQRRFLTEQLARAKAQLDTAEDGLRRFQEDNRAIVLQEQTRGAIEAAARLKAEILAEEVQLGVLRDFATDANPEVVVRRRRIDEMNRQLARMQHGQGPARTTTGGEPRDYSVPFSRVPEVGLELARLTRDVKVQESLVTILTQQVEQARIAEAKDIPVVQILDRAVPAARHSKPRLPLNLALAAVIGLLVGFGLAYLRDLWPALPSRGAGRLPPGGGGRARVPLPFDMAAKAPGVRTPSA